jgi:hypothetical protein
MGSLLYVHSTSGRLRPADRTEQFHELLSGYEKLPGIANEELIINEIVSGMGFTKVTELAEEISLLVGTPEISQSDWLLSPRSDAKVVIGPNPLNIATAHDRKEVDSLLGIVNHSEVDGSIAKIISTAETLGGTVQAQAVVSGLTSFDYLSLAFSDGYQGLGNGSAIAITALGNSFYGFSTLCHILASAEYHVAALLAFDQLEKYQRLSQSFFVLQHQATDLDNFKNLLDARESGVFGQVVSNFNNWASLPDTDVVFASDVISEVDRDGMKEVEQLELNQELLDEDKFDLSSIALGTLSRDFRRLFQPKSVELSSIIADSKRISANLSKFYELIRDYTVSSLSQDQIFMTEAMKSRAGRISTGTLFAPSHIPGQLDQLSMPARHSVYETGQSPNDGYFLSMKKANKLRVSLRETIVEPESLREVIEGEEVKLLVNSLALSHNVTEPIRGYDRVKGLIPADISYGVAYRIGTLARRKDVDDEDETVTESKEFVRQTTINMINAVISSNAFDFLTTVDDQINVYKPEIDALAGGLMLAISVQGGSEVQVLEGNSLPYGVSYASLWSIGTKEEDEIRLTKRIVARPVVAIPKPTGDFSYYEMAPGDGLMIQIPEVDEEGSYKPISVSKEYVVTHPFTCMALSPFTKTRRIVTTLVDELRSHRLTRPIIWKISEGTPSVVEKPLQQRTWEGRRSSFGAKYNIVEFPFTSSELKAEVGDADKPEDRLAAAIDRVKTDVVEGELQDASQGASVTEEATRPPGGELTEEDDDIDDATKDR